MIYTDSCKAKDLALNPSQTVTPLGNYTVGRNNCLSQNAVYEIETRGQDGSYSRSYTQKTLREWVQ